MSDDDATTHRQPQDGAPDVMHSDPDQVREIRRWAIAAIVTTLVVWLLFRYWNQHDDAYTVLHRMYGLCYLLGLGLLAVAYYSMHYARRIFAASQYPPPGGWVLGDTRVLRGGDAQARGRLVAACAIALALLGLYALYLPHSISTMLPGTVPVHMDPPAGKPHG